jgi:hypothetical protein
MLDYIGLGTNNDAPSDSTGNKQTSSCGSSPEQNTEKSNASPGKQARKHMLMVILLSIKIDLSRKGFKKFKKLTTMRLSH